MTCHHVNVSAGRHAQSQGIRAKARVQRAPHPLPLGTLAARASITRVMCTRSPSAVTLSLSSVAASGTRRGLGFAPAHRNAGKGPVSGQPSDVGAASQPAAPRIRLRPCPGVYFRLIYLPSPGVTRYAAHQGAALDSLPANSTFSSQLGAPVPPTGSQSNPPKPPSR